MPTTINGIGTHYYGKQNVEKRWGQCGDCGGEGELVSYDTRLCFCVIFVPLLPLGKKRVIDDCPRCRRHRVIKHSEWEELRGNAIREATAAFEASPNDPDRAIALHATLASSGEQAAATRLVDTLGQRFADNAEVQVYLGNSLEELNETDRSNERFHQAYRADPDSPMAQHASAVALMREGRPDEARRRFEQYESSGEHRVDPSLLFALANAYEQQSDPEAAAELLRRIGEAAPQAKREKAFRQLAKKVEQATSSEPGSLATPPALWQKPAVWWTLAAAAVLAAAVAFDQHTAANQKLYVVNGLPQAITADIDGSERLTVPAGSWRLVTAPVGDHTAQVLQPEALAREVRFQIDPGLFSRWFRNPATVLDPTRSTIVLYEETTYSEKPTNRDEPYELMIGRVARTFPHVDYQFTQFPQSIEIGSKEVRKSRIGLADIGPDVLAFSAPDKAKTPELIDCLEAHLAGGDATASLLSAYASALWDHQQTERGTDFLRAGLKRKPVNVQWHRYYQTLRELAADEGLIDEYDALLAESPDDPGMLYLRARLEDYADRSAPLLERALNADPDNAATLIGKAFSDLAAGRFEDALRLVDRALLADPENNRATELRRQLLPALGRAGELDIELGAAHRADPFNFKATELLMLSAAARGDLNTASKTQSEFAAKVAESWPEDPHQLVTLTLARLHRLRGDTAGADRAADQLKNAETRVDTQWENALAAGDIPRAMRLVDQLPPPSQADAWLWTCLAATTAGDPRADQCRDKAIRAHKQAGGTRRETGMLLAGDRPAGRAALLDERSAEKAALLLLLATPQAGPDAPRLLRLAERLTTATHERRQLLTAALATASKSGG